MNVPAIYDEGVFLPTRARRDRLGNDLSVMAGKNPISRGFPNKAKAFGQN
jgi:hypothetical protein